MSTAFWQVTIGFLASGTLVSIVMLVRARRRSADDADGQERLLYVGSSSLSTALVGELERRADLQWRVLGVVANPARLGQSVGPWLGRIAELPEIIAATCPTRIVVGRLGRSRHAVEQALLDARLSGIEVEDAAHALERATGKMPIEHLSPRSLAFGDGFRHSDIVLADRTHRCARVMSVAGALAGLILGAPFFALAALAIRLDSPGPVLFTQERLGMHGVPFRLFKFRTMHESATRASEWVSDNSHRITRVGRWLRRFRLDELPQLVNVLRGDKNHVGPRPHPASNGPLFLSRIPHYRLRGAVRPGITGWAQIRYGYANGLDEETEKMRYDLYYIKHRSFWFDVQILFLTFAVLLFDNRNHEHVRHAPTGGTWAPAWPMPRSQGVSR
jgi:lipopolysaccharide/colanic/teichoic acid biosynthesis glycosyltransferase